MRLQTLAKPDITLLGTAGLLSFLLFFVAVQPLVSVGCTVGIVALGIAIVRPEWILDVLILTLPLQGIFVFTARANIKISELLGCILIIAIAARLLVWGEGFVTEWRLALPLLIFLGMVLLSTLNTTRLRSVMVLNQYMQPGVGRDSPDTRSYLTSLWGIYAALLFFAIPAVLPTAQRTFRAFRMLLWSSAGTSVFGILQWIYLLRTGDVFDLPGSTQHLNVLHSVAGGFPRSPSSFTEPSVFGLFLVLTLPVSLALAMNACPQIARPRIAGVIFVLQTVALLLSFAVSGYVMFLASMLLFAWLTFRYADRAKVRWLLRRAVVAAVILVISAGLLTQVGISTEDVGAFITDRLVGDADSAQIRFGLARAAVDMAKEHYVTGVGMGNFPFHVLADPTAFAAGLLDFQMPTPSNLFLLYLAELGVPGLVAFLWLLVRVYQFMRRTLSEISPHVRLLHVGLCASMAGALLSFFFLDNLFVNYLWVILGMAVALRRTCRQLDAATSEITRYSE